MKKLNIIAIAICLLSFFSCQSADKNQQKDSDTTELNSFVSGLVKEDTTSVEKLVNTYMTYAQNKQYSEAAAMLFKPDTTDIWNEPVPLDNDEMESVKAVLKRFPVLSYKITNNKQLDFQTYELFRRMAPLFNEMIPHIIAIICNSLKNIKPYQ